MAWCQCAACKQEFGSLTASDQHQDVDYKRRPILICRAPADVGLIQGNDGRWRVPLSAAGAARLENLRAEQPARRMTGRAGK